MRMIYSALLLCLFCRADLLLAQEIPTPQMPPSEALEYSTAPFVAARAQPDDMTQADLFAFSIGIARASQACNDLVPTLEELTNTPNELLALARLCNFGRQYDIARRAAKSYLQLPGLADREKAYLILVQSSLGLNLPVDAASQVFSLESEFPYDPEIHYAADQVILAGTLSSDNSNNAVLGLCTEELRNSLPLLEKGKGLAGKSASVTAGTLFTDAVRCADIARDLHEDSARATLARLQSIVQLPEWRRTAELGTMRSALARAKMIGNPSPAVVSGKLVHATGPLRPLTFSLAHGTNLLIPFTLWSPDAFSIVRDFHATVPRQRIYLLTSWAANTGTTDTESNTVLESLRLAAQSLPAHVSIVVVPNNLLQQFQVDAFPGAIVIKDGIVRANLPLVGDAGKRMTVFALGPIADGPGSQHRAHAQPAK